MRYMPCSSSNLYHPNIGTLPYGVLWYADDLTWIYPCLRTLTEIVRIYKIFASEFNVSFNANKTVFIKLGSKVTEDYKILQDSWPIKWTDQVKHLRNIVNNILSNENDCSLKMSSFNCLIATIVLFGVNFVDYNFTRFQKVLWNKAVGLILGYCAL